MGRLTRDPEVRYSQGERSMAIARYTLAVDRRGRRSQSQDDQEFADSKNASGGGQGGGGYQQPASRPAPSSAIGDGFMNIPDGVEDEGLPFN